MNLALGAQAVMKTVTAAAAAARALGPRWAWRMDALGFELSLVLLGIIWLGYPLAVAVWARWRPYRPKLTPLGAPDEQWPRLSVIISAYNEAGHIEARVRNLWAQQYPPGRMEILVGEDGSNDGTAAVVRTLMAEGGPCPLHLLSARERRGKAAAINRAVQAARGEIIVLTDANNRFTPATLRHLAAPFADASVGAVIGQKSVSTTGGAEGAESGESVYWRYEAWLTRQESRAGSAVSAYGEILALRRSGFTPLPLERLVGDDIYHVFRVLARGERVVAAPEARSLETAALNDGAEWERRKRMAAARWGGLASLRKDWRGLGWGRGLEVVFHQVLRPISALGMVSAMATGLVLLAAPPGTVPGLVRGLAWLQAAACAAIALAAGARWRGWSLGGAEALYFFCLAQLASLGGGWRYLRRSQPALWQRVPRPAGTASIDPAPAPAAGPGPVPGPPPAPAPRPAMDAQRILNGLFWASSSYVAGKLLVFGSIMILARLLAPDAFGAMALAMSAILVLEIFGTLGLTSALIFEEREVDAAARICFWLTAATSVLETAAGWYFAPALAGFFHEPSLAPMLRALTITLVLTALGNTHDTLLRRRLSFRRKMLPDVGASAIKGGAGVVLALLGWGVWSLIWGQVLGSALGTALLWWVTPWRPGWPARWDGRVARRMFRYAQHIYLLDTSSVLLTNFDTLTIGRMLSESWLGFYTLAFRIPEVLLLSVLNVITRVVFPAFSRLQGDRAALRLTVIDTARYTALLTLPVAAGLAVLARPIVLGLYGWHWGPSVPVLEILALYAGVRCLAQHFGDAYKAIGRPDVLTKTTLAWWLLLPPDLILGAHWGGIVGVAWGQVVTRAAITLLHIYLIARYLKIMPSDLWTCFVPALEATAVMGGGLMLVRARLSAWGPRPELALMVPLGMALYVGFLQLRYPHVLRSAWTQLRRGWSHSGPEIEVPAAVGTDPRGQATLPTACPATAAGTSRTASNSASANTVSAVVAAMEPNR